MKTERASNQPESRLRLALVSEPGKAGVKTHVIDVLQRINLDKIAVTYYYSRRRSDANYAKEIEDLTRRGIVCREVPMNAPLRPLLDSVALLRLIRLLRRQRPQIIHLHSSKAGALGRVASLFLFPRPKVLYTPHAMACYRSVVYLWGERILGVLTDLLVAVSPSEKKDFIRWRIPKAKLSFVLTMGLRPPPPMSTAPPGSPVKNEGVWRVGACGRICYQKNALLFFEAALALLKTFQDCRFRWIGDFGDDQEAAAVRALLQKAGWPKEIEITGWVSEPRRCMETLDSFCMFSRYESFGYATAEAMLLGVPVVGTPSTGTVDLVFHERTGLLVKPEVGSVMAALTRLRSDPALGKNLAAEAKRSVSEIHTFAKMMGETEHLYLTADE